MLHLLNTTELRKIDDKYARAVKLVFDYLKSSNSLLIKFVVGMKPPKIALSLKEINFS